MKATLQNGHVGLAKHNDRSWRNDIDGMDKADHIQLISPVMQGAIRIWPDNLKCTLEAYEKQYYRDHYGNTQHRLAEDARRHGRKVRTIDKLYTDKRTRPGETILQYGTRDDIDAINPETLWAAAMEYKARLMRWSANHGNHLHILDMAMHLDESTPHVHVRYVWDYDGRCGLTVGQNRGMEASRIPLPDPARPRGRYNNRQQTWTAMTRVMFQHILVRYGLEIDTSPAEKLMRQNIHKSTPAYRREQAEKELKKQEAAIEDLNKTCRAISASIAEVDQIKQQHEEQLSQMDRDISDKKAELERLNGDIKARNRQKEKLEQDIDVLDSKHTILSEAEVTELQVSVQRSVVPGKVVVPEKLFDRLITTASLVKDVWRKAASVRKDKQHLASKVQKAVEKAKEEAELTIRTLRARIQALENRLAMYQKMEREHPEMKAWIRNGASERSQGNNSGDDPRK